MKRVLFAVALVTGTVGLAGSAAAGITVPEAYSGKNALTAFTRANPPHSPQLTGLPGAMPPAWWSKEPTRWQDLFTQTS